MGADAVDVNMGCPVPKIAKHQAGCALMREPEQAARIVRAMADAVRIPVTVKMRAGWNDAQVNAPDLARRVEDAGAAGVTVHGRTAAQSYSGLADWDLVDRVARSVSIPVLGSGDIIEPAQARDRLRGAVSGALVGRGVLRNPWILAQAADLMRGEAPRAVTRAMRGQFLVDYIDLLLQERDQERAGFRHAAPTRDGLATARPARGRERWVINKIRALNAWYSKGLEGGSQLRVAVNQAESIQHLRDIITGFFFETPVACRG
jgi:nifR3 family TIM-barrel protein